MFNSVLLHKMERGSYKGVGTRHMYQNIGVHRSGSAKIALLLHPCTQRTFRLKKCNYGYYHFSAFCCQVILYFCPNYFLLLEELYKNQRTAPQRGLPVVDYSSCLQLKTIPDLCTSKAPTASRETSYACYGQVWKMFYTQVFFLQCLLCYIISDTW